MIQDFSNDLGVFDGRKDFHFTTASWANADVDVEDPLEKSCPGHSFWFWLWLLIWLDQLKLRWWFRFFGNDLFSMFVVRS